MLKGRSNYACLHRIREGVPDDQGALVDLPDGLDGQRGAARCGRGPRSRRQAKGPGDRDSAPKHTDRVWRQVSVNHRECLGAAKCPFADECFAERAKEKAAQSQLIVTNHSLLAIDAIEGVPMIPEYDVVVIDEAHELSARVTQAATDELSVPEVERAARRAQRHVEGTEADDLADAGDALRAAFDECRPGRLDALPESRSPTRWQLVRDAARALISAFPKESRPTARPTPAAPRPAGRSQELFKNAERMAANSEHDVLWLAERERSRGGDQLCVAPLQVWGPLRDKLLAEKTVVLTSATLMLGGDFSSVATSLGLKPERARRPLAGRQSPEPAGAGGRRPPAVARHRRRLAVRLPAPGHPVRRQAPAPAGARRARRRRSSTRSSTSWTPPTAARSGCSPAAGPPRRRPRRPASGCRT